MTSNVVEEKAIFSALKTRTFASFLIITTIAGIVVGLIMNTRLQQVISSNQKTMHFFAESMIDVLELQSLAESKAAEVRRYLIQRQKKQFLEVTNLREKFLSKLNEILQESRDQMSLDYHHKIKESELAYHAKFLENYRSNGKSPDLRESTKTIINLLPLMKNLSTVIIEFAKYRREELQKANQKLSQEAKKSEKLFLLSISLLIILWAIISFILFKSFALLKKSELKKIEALAKLDESILRFKDLVNHLDHSIVWEATANPFKFNFVSERSNIIFGVDSNEMMNDAQAMFRHIHPDDIEQLKKCIEAATLSKKDIRCEHRVYIPGEGLRWIQTRVHYRTDQKNMITLYGLSLDITSNKNNEFNLQRALKEVQQYKYALDSSLIIVMTDAAGKIIKVNNQFSKIAHYAPDELNGVNFKILCTGIHSEHFYREMLSTLKTGNLWRNETEMRTKNNNLFWVDAVIVPFMDEQGKPWRYMAILNDITAKKNAGIEREKLIHDLQLEKKARLKFVNTLTHDLRTPLTAAKIASQMIAMKREDPEKVLELSYKIKNAINRTDNMIQDLLDADRIRAGQPLILKPEYSELKEILSEAIEEQSLIHGNRFLLKTNGPLHGYWDKMGIRRMADNLLSNAIKYGKQDEKIVISIAQENDWATFTVFNQGERLTSEEMKSLFSHYHRLQKAVEGHIKGWGIGLTLVKGIAEAHGGRVEVQSNDEGITFKVFLKTVQNHLQPQTPHDTISS